MSDDVRRIFMVNLRRYMNAAEVTQADMARYFGISTATTSDWYNGRKIPRADKLQAIADWLGVGIGDLLTESDTVADRGYYLSNEAAEIADQIIKNEDLRFLFDAAKGLDSESLRAAAAMLRRMRRTGE